MPCGIRETLPAHEANAVAQHQAPVGPVMLAGRQMPPSSPDSDEPTPRPACRVRRSASRGQAEKEGVQAAQAPVKLAQPAGIRHAAAVDDAACQTAQTVTQRPQCCACQNGVTAGPAQTLFTSAMDGAWAPCQSVVYRGAASQRFPWRLRAVSKRR